MPITIPDYNTVVWPQVLAFFRNRFPGRDTHPESFLGKTARAVARSIGYFLVSLQSVDQDAVPSQKTSLAALRNMAVAFGIPADASGNFGQRPASSATGGQGNCTGTNGVTFPDGSLLYAPDGVTVVKLVGGVTISGAPPGTGSVLGYFAAVTPGTAGNLPAGSVLTWQAAPTGADATVTLTAALSGGTDLESPASLLSRILGRWQNPPKGGTGRDYRTWAESVTGVARAYVYPKKAGSGSVVVVVTSSSTDGGIGRDPGSGVAASVANYINGNPSTSPPVQGQRPVTASAALVARPYVTGTGLYVRVRIVPSANKYAFDWSLGMTVFTVASYASGVLTMGQSLPTSLTQAIDAYKANPSVVQAPRLQVMSLNLAAPGIAVPVQAVDYNAGAKTLTLQSPLPSSWVAPSSGDAVFPYSSAVPVVAKGVGPTPGGVQGYVLGLGPSRASGYADPNDVWSDTASIYTIGQVALDALDSDGVTKPAARVLAATINAASSDVQATDTPANGIQLLTVSKIAVTD